MGINKVNLMEADGYSAGTSYMVCSKLVQSCSMISALSVQLCLLSSPEVTAVKKCGHKASVCGRLHFVSTAAHRAACFVSPQKMFPPQSH